MYRSCPNADDGLGAIRGIEKSWLCAKICNKKSWNDAKKDAATLGDVKKPENAGQWNAYRNGELIGHSANGNVNYIYKDDDF